MRDWGPDISWMHTDAECGSDAIRGVPDELSGEGFEDFGVVKLDLRAVVLQLVQPLHRAFEQERHNLPMGRGKVSVSSEEVRRALFT